MDQQTPNNGNDQQPNGQPDAPQYAPPQYAPPYQQPYPGPGQPTMSPMGYGWAPGVAPVTVAPRSRRLRWTLAAAVVVVVMVATAAGAFVLSGAAGSKSLTAGIAPRNSMLFMEVRTDLPGDQHTKLADFMSHFPGFKDRGLFDNALDQMLSNLTGSISSDLRYSSAFKPWMEGEVSVAVTSPAKSTTAPLGCGSLYGPNPAFATVPPLPDDYSFDPSLFSYDPNASFDLGALESMYPGLFSYDPNSYPELSTGSTPEAIAIFALKDRSAAETWVAGEMARIGAKITSQDYAGTKLYTTGAGYSQAAYAFTNQDLVIGTVGGVKASLDTKTNGSLAGVANYQAAMKSVPAESIAHFYVDMSSYLGTYADSLSQLSCLYTSPGAKALPTMDMRNVPAWLGGSIRAESDRMVVEMSMPGTGSQHAGNHASTLASSLPGSTVGVYEMHSIGQSITVGLDSMSSYSSGAGLDTSIKTIKDMLTRIGGVEWIGDGAAAVTKTGDTFDGGVVVQVADAATAKTKVDMITNLVAIAGGSIKATSRDETYKGVGITVISIPSSSGMPPLEIAIGAKDSVIVAGYTDAFVKAVIDTTPANSLASQPDYSAAIGASGSSNSGSMYVNVPALEDYVGRTAFSSTPSRWTQDYKPYFDHIGGVAYSVVDGNTVTMRFVVLAR